MLILPDRHIPRSKILLPVHDYEWRAPSQAQPKDCFGRENHTRFRVRARLNDGYVKWCGWFDDRADFDAFLWAIATGSLQYERELWRLPSPWWDPEFGEDVTYEFVTQVFLSTASSSPYTSPSDWNNASNSIETLGAGASGGANRASVGTGLASGGGGGAWNKILTFSFASPGTTTAVFTVGVGGTTVQKTGTDGSTTGNAGGDTFFNGATLGASSVGSKGGGAGQAGTAVTVNGGTGGVGASGVGTSSNDGGRGGNLSGTVNSRCKTGGAGAAGSTGAGNQGVDLSSGTNVTSDGGSGDAGSGGSAGVASTSAGGNGTEWDGTHGSGGGGGAASGTAFAGGNYGGGGGGAVSTSTANSGAGIGGQIYLQYTPTGVTFFGGQIFELPGRKSAVIGY